MPARSMS